MPLGVNDLFAAAGISPAGVVSWGARIPAAETGLDGMGVYVIALTNDANATEGAAQKCSTSLVAVEELLEARPELTLDGERPSAEALARRLAAFWCVDEVVLYIGSAGPRQRIAVSELSDRVQEYYDTPLGARSPHAGGWPLKTLANLRDLHVHYAYCNDVERRENLMLEVFAKRLSNEARAALHDSTHVMPFANLEDARRRRKAHGIKGAKAPRVRSREARPLPTATQAVTPPASPPGDVSTIAPRYQTQRVTAADIRRGVVRIPGHAKVLFPPTRTSIDVELRGQRKSCRWDPRYGPDQERSGVLGLGTALTARLTEGQRLSIRLDSILFLA